MQGGLRGSSGGQELAQDVELLIGLYDKRGGVGGAASGSSRGISHWSFIEMLTPQQHIEALTQSMIDVEGSSSPNPSIYKF